MCQRADGNGSSVGHGQDALRACRYLSRLLSVDSKAATWSVLEMPSGTSVAVMVTRVPGSTSSRDQVIVMVPASVGSSETKSASSTSLRGSSTMVNRTSTTSTLLADLPRVAGSS